MSIVTNSFSSMTLHAQQAMAPADASRASQRLAKGISNIADSFKSNISALSLEDHQKAHFAAQKNNLAAEKNNLDDATATLSAAQNGLNQINVFLDQAKTYAAGAADATLSEDDRKQNALAYNTMLDTINTTVQNSSAANGKNLLAGGDNNGLNVQRSSGGAISVASQNMNAEGLGLSALGDNFSSKDAATTLASLDQAKDKLAGFAVNIQSADYRVQNEAWNVSASGVDASSAKAMVEKVNEAQANEAAAQTKIDLTSSNFSLAAAQASPMVLKLLR